MNYHHRWMVPARTGRRDFYKMGLVKGDMTIDYGG
jgi:hypothetical protein